ncbi:hypothetical protein SUGI_0918950 [Cryptomeria japonica]|nr:hypothetical protein SUGI_0918950 [Cryptomeria japonica]
MNYYIVCLSCISNRSFFGYDFPTHKFIILASFHDGKDIYKHGEISSAHLPRLASDGFSAQLFLNLPVYLPGNGRQIRNRKGIEECPLKWCG